MTKALHFVWIWGNIKIVHIYGISVVTLLCHRIQEHLIPIYCNLLSFSQSAFIRPGCPILLPSHWITYFFIAHMWVRSYDICLPELGLFPQHSDLWFYPWGCEWQDFIIYYGWVILHCEYVSLFFNPFIIGWPLRWFPFLGCCE